MEGVPTLETIAKSLNPDGTIAMPADIVSQQNDILRDAPYLEGNLPDGHRSTVLSELPEAYWYRYYRGSIASHSVKQQITDDIGHLQSRSRIDYEEARFNGLSQKWRLAEDQPHIQSVGEQAATTIFYGDHQNSLDEFNGLAQRYSSLTGNMEDQIIDCGGTTGNLTSLWLIGWGENTVNLRYPKNQPQTDVVKTTDLGVRTIDRSDDYSYEVMETKYDMKMGLSVKNYQYVVRLCNIPVGSLTAAGSTYDLWTYLIEMTERIKSLNGVMPRFYMNRRLRSWLTKQAFNKSNIQLSPVELANGERPMGFQGIPFRRCDAILNTEDVVA